MKRYYSDGRIPTLEVALTENMNADDLKKLAKHTNQKIPTRKADIATVIKRERSKNRSVLRYPFIRQKITLRITR